MGILERGWKTLPQGCGGLVTGFTIADDGVMYCRTDVGGVYRWSGTANDSTNPNDRWIQLMTYDSFGATTANRLAATAGGYAIACAPTQSSRCYAIMSTITGGSPNYKLYVTNDYGAHWTATGLTLANADSNSPSVQRTAQQKIAVDPWNPDVVYVGMPQSSGNGTSVYRSTNGSTFSSLGFADTTLTPGSCGIAFYKGTAPIDVGGQSRTARIIVPVGGVGIYESTDGGVNFTEVFASAIGTSTISVTEGYFDYDGVYYCIVSMGSGSGWPWRYRSGVWKQLDGASATGWTGTKSDMFQGSITASITGGSASTAFLDVTNVGTSTVTAGQRVYDTAGTLFGTIAAYGTNGTTGVGGNGTYAFTASVSSSASATHLLVGSYYLSSTGLLIVDPRDTHQGYLSVSGPNGFAAGYTSINANHATLASVTWGGYTGGETVTLLPPTYEPGWYADLPSGVSAFLSASQAIIDQNGRCWFAGTRAFWYCGTPAIPRFDTGNTPSYVPMARGMEMTVAEDAIVPPGNNNAVMVAQDVGVMCGGFRTFPGATWRPNYRTDAQYVAAAASDPHFIVARATQQLANSNLQTNSFGMSVYSTDSGKNGTWTQYTNQPDGAYTATFTGGISSGLTTTLDVTTSGSRMVVSAVTGTIYIGSVLTGSTIRSGTTISEQISGTPGGTGEYILNQSQTTPIATPTSITATYGILTVSAITSGDRIQIGHDVYLTSSPTTSSKGTVGAFLSGTGGLGTYIMTSTPTTYPAGTTFVAYRGTQGGCLVAVDSSTHLFVPSGFNQMFCPVRTTDTGATEWSFCPTLPTLRWTNRSYVFGETARPLAPDYGTALGTVYASVITNTLYVVGAVVSPDNPPKIRLTVFSTAGLTTGMRRYVNAIPGVTAATGAWTITVIDDTHIELDGSTFSGTYTGSTGTIDGVNFYKSTDSGATWSYISSIAPDFARHSPVLHTTPGYPGHLWWISNSSSAGGVGAKLFRSTDGGVTWSTSIVVPGLGIPKMFTLGAPEVEGGYPTLFMGTWGGNNTATTLYYSTDQGANWSILGATGTQADLPVSCQLVGLKAIVGTNIFKQLIGITGQMGFAFYDVIPDKAPPLHMGLKGIS